MTRKDEVMHFACAMATAEDRAFRNRRAPVFIVSNHQLNR
jgi:hypothetical protein